MTALKIGYARVSADAQDLTAQRRALDVLGVERDHVYVDHGFTGTSRDRPDSATIIGEGPSADGRTLLLHLCTWHLSHELDHDAAHA